MDTHRLTRICTLALVFVACARELPPTQPVPAAAPVVAAPTAAPITSETPEAPNAAPVFVAGPGGLPLPLDATEKPMPGGILMFEVPRGREDVGFELKALLAADGWTIDSEEVSPRLAALRLKVSKDGKTIDARVAGDDTRAGIIVTLPKT